LFHSYEQIFPHGGDSGIVVFRFCSAARATDEGNMEGFGEPTISATTIPNAYCSILEARKHMLPKE